MRFCFHTSFSLENSKGEYRWPVPKASITWFQPRENWHAKERDTFDRIVGRFRTQQLGDIGNDHGHHVGKLGCLLVQPGHVQIRGKDLGQEQRHQAGQVEDVDQDGDQGRTAQQGTPLHYQRIKHTNLLH